MKIPNLFPVFFSGIGITISLLIVGCSIVSLPKKEHINAQNENDSISLRPIEAVAALGQLSPAGDIRRLAAPLSGFGGTPRVAELLVKEGDMIKKGEIIVRFDNRPQILSDLLLIEARLNTLGINRIMQLKEINRYRKVALEGAASLVLLEEKEDELVKIEGQINEALAEKNSLEVDLGNSELKSPIDGVVLRIYAREGERSGSDGVLEVGANQEMQALIEVYESDIGRVKTNQKVSLVSENGGFEGVLKGVVYKISPQVRQRKVLSTDPTGDSDARVVKVTVALDSESSLIVSNLTGMKVIARFEP